MAKPTKCISVSEARDLQNNWNATRASEIQKTQGYTDAKDFTFNLEELQEFIDYVRDESGKQGISTPGIRIYFAAYNTLQNNKATVFLAPTKGIESDSENNYEIDPLNRNQGGFPPNVY
ncbi:MAG: hypothetical protein R2776_04710 [Flavobacteriaceae bacterium]